jgi:hypothetical protein
MKNVRVPQPLNDLYRDLRDRRLLIPAVGLIVALVAVPFVLAKDPAPVSAPLAPPPAEATAAQPAVLAEQVGIRDYRKRLEALKSKNPFKQQFALPTPESVAIADDGGGSTSSTDAATGSLGTASTSTGLGSTSSDLPTASPATPVPQPAPGTVKHTRKLITRVVDVTLGPLGETKKYDNVKRTDVLPSNDEPLIAYFGANPNGKRAAFLISSTVVSSDGDGTCSPDPDTCSFVTMKEGDQRYLHVQPEGEAAEVVYRFKLRKIEEKVVKGSREEL